MARLPEQKAAIQRIAINCGNYPNLPLQLLPGLKSIVVECFCDEAVVDDCANGKAIVNNLGNSGLKIQHLPLFLKKQRLLHSSNNRSLFHADFCALSLLWLAGSLGVLDAAVLANLMFCIHSASIFSQHYSLKSTYFLAPDFERSASSQAIHLGEGPRYEPPCCWTFPQKSVL
ncbi:hypothetical protein IG631_14572 [Alternaria alternata]|nr:hypothetical protein IG631_14572 [Alternaria alternata]